MTWGLKVFFLLLQGGGWQFPVQVLCSVSRFHHSLIMTQQQRYRFTLLLVFTSIVLCCSSCWVMCDLKPDTVIFHFIMKQSSAKHFSTVRLFYYSTYGHCNLNPEYKMEGNCTRQPFMKDPCQSSSELFLRDVFQTKFTVCVMERISIRNYFQTDSVISLNKLNQYLLKFLNTISVECFPDISNV